MVRPITEHEGRKYLTLVNGWSAVSGSPGERQPVYVDVYCVLRAFGVTCPGRQQAIKKLLMAGRRGKGSELDDLVGADAALSRAIEDLREEIRLEDERRG